MTIRQGDFRSVAPPIGTEDIQPGWKRRAITKRQTRICHRVYLGWLITCAFAATPSIGAPLYYSITDLGTFGGSNSIARAINEDGWSVGSAQVAGGNAWRAFLLPPGETLDVATDSLGTLGGDSHAIDLNAGLIVVGVSRLADNTTRRAFVYDGATMLNLNDRIPAGSGWILVEANDINDQGLIVGTGTFGGQTHGFLLTPSDPPIFLRDMDGDEDVDLDDYELFEGCASGPAIPVAVGCEAADVDNDADADHQDFGYLQQCWSGPGVPVDAKCVVTSD